MTVANPSTLTEGHRLAGEEQQRIQRRNRRDRLIVLGCQIAFVVGVTVAWEYAPEVGLFDPFFISRPSLILNALRQWIADGSLWQAALLTLVTAVYGFVIGSVLGFLTGLVLGTSRWLGQIFMPFISALQSIPRLALVPLFILWFGIGSASKVALVSTVVFFLVFAATRSGVAAVDAHLTNALRIMNASMWQVHLKATLPSAMVWIIDGLRISIPWALVSTVTAEILSANEGLGYLIARSASQFYTAGVFAGIFVLTLLGIMLTLGVALVEKRLLAWRTASQI